MISPMWRVAMASRILGVSQKSGGTEGAALKSPPDLRWQAAQSKPTWSVARRVPQRQCWAWRLRMSQFRSGWAVVIAAIVHWARSCAEVVIPVTHSEWALGAEPAGDVQAERVGVGDGAEVGFQGAEAVGA